MKRDLYAEVSARIIAELEQGAPPWIRPWSTTLGANSLCNAVSNRPYSGCNVPRVAAVLAVVVLSVIVYRRKQKA